MTPDTLIAALEAARRASRARVIHVGAVAHHAYWLLCTDRDPDRPELPPVRAAEPYHHRNALDYCGRSVTYSAKLGDEEVRHG